jgi:hypothetical protein
MVPIINEALNEFINILKETKEKELNFYAFYQNLILDIIRRTAFGADTQVQTNSNDQFLFTIKEEFAKTANQGLVKLSFCFPEFFWIIQAFRRLIEMIKELFDRSSTSKLRRDCALILNNRSNSFGFNRNDILQMMIYSVRHKLSSA